MLVGTDIAAATAIVDALGVPVMGLNCATGPKEMAEHVRHLVADLARADLVPAQCRPARAALRPHPLSADARRARRAGSSGSSPRTAINIVGGCCGTTVEHIARPRRHAAPAPPRTATARAAGRASRSTRRRWPRCSRPCRCARRTRSWRSASAATPTARRNSASCRRPATGTAASPWAASRSREGSNALDVCTAFVGRDEVAEMNAVVARMRGQVDSPLVIDSTELPVLEAALELYGGKAVLNSINFEDGEAAGDRPDDARAQVRRGGDRADHRRGRHGQDRARTSCGSPAGWSTSPAAASACRSRTCCSTR